MTKPEENKLDFLLKHMWNSVLRLPKFIWATVLQIFPTSELILWNSAEPEAPRFGLLLYIPNRKKP